VICSLVSIANLGAGWAHVQRRYRISGMHLVHCNTIPSHALRCSNDGKWRIMSVPAVDPRGQRMAPPECRRIRPRAS
jgi:hypothetical protein